MQLHLHGRSRWWLAAAACAAMAQLVASQPYGFCGNFDIEIIWVMDATERGTYRAGLSNSGLFQYVEKYMDLEGQIRPQQLIWIMADRRVEYEFGTQTGLGRPYSPRDREFSCAYRRNPPMLRYTTEMFFTLVPPGAMGSWGGTDEGVGWTDAMWHAALHPDDYSEIGDAEYEFIHWRVMVVWVASRHINTVENDFPSWTAGVPYSDMPELKKNPLDPMDIRCDEYLPVPEAEVVKALKARHIQPWFFYDKNDIVDQAKFWSSLKIIEDLFAELHPVFKECVIQPGVPYETGGDCACEVIAAESCKRQTSSTTSTTTRTTRTVPPVGKDENPVVMATVIGASAAAIAVGVAAGGGAYAYMRKHRRRDPEAEETTKLATEQSAGGTTQSFGTEQDLFC